MTLNFNYIDQVIVELNSQQDIIAPFGY